MLSSTERSLYVQPTGKGMFMNTQTTLDESQATASQAAKTALEETTGYVLEKNFVAARRSSEAATLHISNLQRLYSTGPYRPREQLTLDIDYFSTWLIALKGYTEITKKGGLAGVGRFLLKRALLQANDLVDQHPGTPKLSELARLIEEWMTTPEDV